MPKHKKGINLKQRYPATQESLPQVLKDAEQFAEQAGCAEDVVMKLVLVVEELVVNVIHYAYGDTMGDLCIQFSSEQDTLTMVLTDQGQAFNPLSSEKPNTSLGDSERPVGGLGIFLVKQLAKSLTYQRENEQNIVTIVLKKSGYPLI